MRRRDRISAAAGTVGHGVAAPAAIHAGSALRGKPDSLLRRAQQWLAARERLLSAWYARTQAKSRGRSAALGQHQDSTGAIVLPYWWEYESPLKRRLALEALLRRMFSIAPRLLRAAT